MRTVALVLLLLTTAAHAQPNDKCISDQSCRDERERRWKDPWLRPESSQPVRMPSYYDTYAAPPRPNPLQERVDELEKELERQEWLNSLPDK